MTARGGAGNRIARDRLGKESGYADTVITAPIAAIRSTSQ
jgi:hypothetical protein